MAYKNQKRNKAHIKELRNDPDNWRNIRRKKKKKKIEEPMSMDEMERLIKKMG